MSHASEFFKLIPKDLQSNIKFRKNMMKLDKEEQDCVKAIVHERSIWGFLCWCNAFAFTYDPRLKEGYRNVPFILYPYQEDAAHDLYNSIIDSYDILIEKTRDTGASYLCLALMTWYFLAYPDTSFLAVSRNESYVDSGTDSKTLLFKVRYLITNLPSWLQPNINSRHLLIENLDNRSKITGESTTGQVARGARLTAILMDEMAFVEHAKDVLMSTGDATQCRWFVSTPNGSGNTFANIRFSGKTKVLTFHWPQHPIKGKDKKQIIVDGLKKWTSPWYEAECKRRLGPQEVAQELDIDYLASGFTFFDGSVLNQIRHNICREPEYKGDIKYNLTVSKGIYTIDDISFNNNGDEFLKIFAKLDKDNKLNQEANYVGFADISLGNGSSNSTFVVCRTGETLEHVLTYASPFVQPHDFADTVIAICRWVGGQQDVFLGFERNGPGLLFSKRVYDTHQYPYVYFQRSVLDKTEKRSKRKFGWFSTKDAKRLFLSDFKRSLAEGQYNIYDSKIIDEAERYVVARTGSIEPQALLEDDTGARHNHGDRVIAAAGALLMSYEQVKYNPPARIIPKYSPAYFIKQQQQKRRNGEW